MSAQQDVEAFISRWSPGGGSERSNYQMFLAELCDLLAIDRPDPSKPENAENAYVFDRALQRTKLPWPKTLPAKVTALRALLPTTGEDPALLASHFGKRTKTSVQEITQILQTLKDFGQL